MYQQLITYACCVPAAYAVVDYFKAWYSPEQPVEKQVTEYTLENWSVYVSPNDEYYTAPECIPRRLRGRRGDVNVITSGIKSVEGRRVTTVSGNVYVLGEINPEYLAWMNENGLTYDKVNPIRVIGK